MKTKRCPFCFSENVEERTIPHKDGRDTEIFVCDDCPGVWFTYYNQYSWMDVGAMLGLDKVEQI